MAERNATTRSGVMPVIFTPEGMKVLLYSPRFGFNGKQVFLGASPLRDKIGERIADERFTLLDDPLLDYGPLSGEYDAEGVPHRVLPLIEAGSVGNFLYDLDTAGLADAESTGHGIGCNPTNWVVQEGDTPLEEMIKGTREGLIVETVLGLGQGNPMSGTFSVNVHLGYKIEDGEVVGRVKNVMMAGNAYEALGRIEAIGNRAEWTSSSLRTPPVKVSGLHVVAR
jgi:PmbA protein